MWRSLWNHPTDEASKPWSMSVIHPVLRTSSDTMELVPTQEDISAFREWLRKVPYLKQDVDDYFISGFIQGAKGRMEKAKSTFDNFQNVANQNAELFSGLDPSSKEIACNFTSGFLCMAPVLTKDGAMVVSGALIEPDPNKFSLVGIYKSLHLIVLLILLDPEMPVRYGEKWNGKVELVWDMANFRMGHLSQYTPTIVKSAMDYMSSAIPCRMSAMHFINASPACERLFNFMKTFLKKKLADRFHVYSDPAALNKVLPDHVLPRDMNGSLPSGMEMNDILLNRLIKNRDMLMEWDEEMKRLGKIRPRKQEDIIVGTFKKLQFD